MAWTRSRLLKESESYLWQYLAGIREGHMVESSVEGVFGLGRGDLKRLVAVHLLVSEITSTMLAAAEQVVRNMAGSVSVALVESSGHVRPPIDWSRTRLLQWATSDETRYVSRPPLRAYDTPIGRLVVHCLEAALSLSQAARLNANDPISKLTSQRVQHARGLLHHSKLASVTTVHSLPERVLAQMDRRRGLPPLVAFARSFRDAFMGTERETILETVRSQLLRPTTDDKLFELLVGFKLKEAMANVGYEPTTPRLLPTSGASFSELRRGSEALAIWAQRSMHSVEKYKGAYEEAALKSGLSVSRLRPDFIIEDLNSGEIRLVVEAKLTQRDSEYSPDREGIRDVLAYLLDASALFDGRPEPHALVVAANSSAVPADHRIVVTAPESIDEAVRKILILWQKRRSPSLAGGLT